MVGCTPGKTFHSNTFWPENMNFILFFPTKLQSFRRVCSKCSSLGQIPSPTLKEQDIRDRELCDASHRIESMNELDKMIKLLKKKNQALLINMNFNGFFYPHSEGSAKCLILPVAYLRE